MKKRLIFLFLILLPALVAFAHGGKKHKKDSTRTAVDSTLNKIQSVESDTVRHHTEMMLVDESKVTADFDDFPTIHPLIVHFAIVLIIVAAALQLLNVYLLKKEVAWIVSGILLAGVAAAWFASRNFHPHTHGISDHAQLVLAQHDKWADWTIYLGFVGLILHTANLFFLKAKRSPSIVVALVLIGSAYSVGCAGHYGSQLVHIEGIGPQGKYLEMKHHH